MLIQRDNRQSPPKPTKILASSAIARLLWVHRARRAGFTVSSLCSALGREPKAIRQQLRVLDRLLVGTGLRLATYLDPEDGFTHYYLASPHWQRPAARPQIADYVPAFISLDELKEEQERNERS